MITYTIIRGEMFIGLILMRLLILIVIALSGCAQAGELKVQQGIIQGVISKYNANVEVFRGVPYATPPIGSRRWRPAEPAEAWSGVRLAQDFGPDCMQPSLDSKYILSRPAVLQSEDCLYLNLWMPKASHDSNKKLPVMVWIHGGGLIGGSGSIPLYDGSELARKGVIVVTFNYRLGIFGFFAHPELVDESPNGASGNYGISDQIEALKWLGKNVHVFGGDPDNITIFGESSGAWSVSLLMASNLAKGLFHKAIAQSGAYFSAEPKLELFSMPKLKQFLDKKLYQDKKRENLVSLPLHTIRGISSQKLLDIATDKEIGQHKVIVDGWIFHEPILDVYRAGKQYKVPLIVGCNGDEASIMPSDVLPNAKNFSDPLDYINSVNRHYKGSSKKILSQYSSGNIATSQHRMAVDKMFCWPMSYWAKLMAHASSDSYVYHFEHVSSGSSKFGAFHTSEISYVFNNERHSFRYSDKIPVASPSKNDLKIADVMSDYWVGFARSGVPNVRGQPVWFSYNEVPDKLMQFGFTVKMAVNPYANLFQIPKNID